MKQSEQSDTQIVKESLQNPAAFIKLYERYFDRIWRYFNYRFYYYPDVCEDLTAQTFENALTKIHQYDFKRGEFPAWLFGIARNICNRYLNNLNRIEILPTENIEYLATKDDPAEIKIINDEIKIDLIRHVQELSERKKELIALKFAGCFSNRQIGEITGLTEQNVAVILFRTIRELREKLDGKENANG
ncbi:MAG: hypothetical protein CL609_21740 [Anaerolineaceae bacterium]|nr:hypothetical protein [Anaerolineaceae bacterium]